MRMITLSILLLSLLSPISETRAEINTTPVLILRDPFQQPVRRRDTRSSVKEVAKTKPKIIDESTQFKLKAVMLNGEKSMININGKILAVGDEIDGYRLMKILANQAFLEKNSLKVVVFFEK